MPSCGGHPAAAQPPGSMGSCWLGAGAKPSLCGQRGGCHSPGVPRCDSVHKPPSWGGGGGVWGVPGSGSPGEVPGTGEREAGWNPRGSSPPSLSPSPGYLSLPVPARGVPVPAGTVVVPLLAALPRVAPPGLLPEAAGQPRGGHTAAHAPRVRPRAAPACQIQSNSPRGMLKGTFRLNLISPPPPPRPGGCGAGGRGGTMQLKPAKNTGGGGSAFGSSHRRN